MILIFTGFVLYIFYKKGAEPTVIIASFFAFMTGEVWALAKIKLTEIKIEEKTKKEVFIDGFRLGVKLITEAVFDKLGKTD